MSGPGFASQLGVHGDRLAVLAQDGTRLTYRELDAMTAAAATRLGSTRRLVLLAAANDVDSLVAYLGALRGGHPVLVAAPGQTAALVTAYDPDVVVDGYWRERRAGTAHDLHPELALLLSTSGSTGSPKAVRLSTDNLATNAAAIVEALDIRSTDRAVASLPMHYCYGLSVVNSNLARGACLVLTDRSVLDPEFWAQVRDSGATSLHGVPHTFDLLDRIGFEQMDLPSLRYVTQAGGRLAPDQVVRYAELGRRRGWRFIVMYGQTEATARMACLSPDMAPTRPSAIGLPIPGGKFRIADDGELVYRGPNVMLGYARRPADLALGRTVHELPTGDLALRTADGLYELVGRKSRFVKLFGVRVDLDQIERIAAAAGIDAAAAGADDGLTIAVRGRATAVRRARALIRRETGLPDHVVHVRRVVQFPRLPNGKLDYPAITALHRSDRAERSVRQVFATVLGVRDVPGGATFVDLGGDSLSYVRTSVALQRILGFLPRDWPTTPVAQLERLQPARPRTATTETSIVLRALAIVLIVGTHIGAFQIHGGGHLLLAIAGWNFARFLLPGPPSRIARSAASIAAIAVAWLVYRMLVTDDVTLVNVLLINSFVHTGPFGYWFVEALVHVLAVLAVVFAVPAVRRAEQSHGFLVAAAALAAALLARLVVEDAESFYVRHLSTLGALWFFALGWLAERATTTAQKGIVVALAAVLVPITFGNSAWAAGVLIGVVLLVALARLPIPRPATGTIGLLASSSLAIYLTHYAIYPELQPHLHPVVILLICLAAGVTAWWVAQRVNSALRQVRITLRDRRRTPARRDRHDTEVKAVISTS